MTQDQAQNEGSPAWSATAGRGSSVPSGAGRPRAAPPLTWDEPYSWTVTATTNGASTTVGPVSITPAVPQPDMSSQLGVSGGPATSGGSSGEPFDPESGNYTTSAVDAAVTVAGAPLRIARTYNSLNPSVSGAFGAGWSSVLDTGVAQDNDGSGSVVVTLPDGSQARFGYTGTRRRPRRRM